MLGIDGLESCNHEGCKLNLMALSPPTGINRYTTHHFTILNLVVLMH